MLASTVGRTCLVLLLPMGSWPSSAFSQQPEPFGLLTSFTPGPLERRANPITRENPIPRRTYAIAPDYPLDAVQQAVTLSLCITLDQSGRIAEARRIAVPAPPPGRPEPDHLRPYWQAASDSVRLWQYEPPVNAPISFYVQFDFTPDSNTTMTWHEAAPPPRALVSSPAPAALPVDAPRGPVRVGDGIAAPKKVRDVKPVYPSIAQGARISGTVLLEVDIATDGRVANARVLRSIPLLDQAALDAVRQWQFMPTLLNGVPVPVVTTVTVSFRLK